MKFYRSGLILSFALLDSTKSILEFIIRRYRTMFYVKQFDLECPPNTIHLRQFVRYLKTVKIIKKVKINYAFHLELFAQVLKFHSRNVTMTEVMICDFDSTITMKNILNPLKNLQNVYIHSLDEIRNPLLMNELRIMNLEYYESNKFQSFIRNVLRLKNLVELNITAVGDMNQIFNMLRSNNYFKLQKKIKLNVNTDSMNHIEFGQMDTFFTSSMNFLCIERYIDLNSLIRFLACAEKFSHLKALILNLSKISKNEYFSIPTNFSLFSQLELLEINCGNFMIQEDYIQKLKLPQSLQSIACRMNLSSIGAIFQEHSSPRKSLRSPTMDIDPSLTKSPKETSPLQLINLSNWNQIVNIELSFELSGYFDPLFTHTYADVLKRSPYLQRIKIEIMDKSLREPTWGNGKQQECYIDLDILFEIMSTIKNLKEITIRVPFFRIAKASRYSFQNLQKFSLIQIDKYEDKPILREDLYNQLNALIENFGNKLHTLELAFVEPLDSTKLLERFRLLKKFKILSTLSLYHKISFIDESEIKELGSMIQFLQSLRNLQLRYFESDENLCLLTNYLNSINVHLITSLIYS